MSAQYLLTVRNILIAGLRFVKLRGTRVRREGLGLLLRCCLTLEGVRCNVMDVLQAMSSYLKVSSQLSPEKK